MTQNYDNLRNIFRFSDVYGGSSAKKKSSFHFFFLLLVDETFMLRSFPKKLGKTSLSLIMQISQVNSRKSS